MDMGAFTLIPTAVIQAHRHGLPHAAGKGAGLPANLSSNLTVICHAEPVAARQTHAIPLGFTCKVISNACRLYVMITYITLSFCANV